MTNDDVFTVADDFPLARMDQVLNEIADVFIARNIRHVDLLG